MALFRTVVDVEENTEKLDYNSKSVWMGSCFTENIGSRLKNLKFATVVNPFGVLYNPESIENTLLILIEKRLFQEKDVDYYDGLWYSFYHHSNYSHTERDKTLHLINKNIEYTHEVLKDASFLFITFGTARVYRYIETGKIVSNCHKIPNYKFDHHLLEPEEIVASYETLLRKLSAFNPKLKVVFTISPVRHWKDGAHGNQVSKATLFLAINKLRKIFKEILYFPAYEIVMDELRDYRFYKKDMFHIDEAGTDYIWDRFKSSFFDRTVLGTADEINKLKNGLEHSPFNPFSENYKLFLNNLLARITELEKDSALIDFSDEKTEIIKRLNTFF